MNTSALHSDRANPPGRQRPARGRRPPDLGAPPTACFILGLLGLLGGPLSADRLYLTGGGVIEGKVISEERNTLRVAGLAGVLDVPALLVVRRVHETSRVEQYEALRDARPLDAARHASLAQWCLDQKLPLLARQHVEEALKLDPGQIEARRLAGYIPLGDVWFKVGELPAAPADAAASDARIIDQLRSGWHRRIHGLRDSFLRETDAGARTFENGRQQLLAIEAPLAVEAACPLLSDGGTRQRLLLVEFLEGFDHDAARSTLLAIALLDNEAEIRLAAADALARQGDERVVQALRDTLRCEVDEMVRRAAVALGRLGDPAACLDLISALPTDAYLGQRRSLATIMRDVEQQFADPLSIPLDDRLAEVPPRIALPELSRRIEHIQANAAAPASRFRSEVQEALIALSGQNFGFDAQAWRTWLAEHEPAQQRP